MRYIYTLSLDGLVFYIGQTSDPLARYNQHYHDCLSRAYYIARYCLCHHNKAIEMDILCVVSSREVLIKEREYIESFSKKYHLINNDNYDRWRLMLGLIPKLNTNSSLKPFRQKIREQLNKLKCQQ